MKSINHIAAAAILLGLAFTFACDKPQGEAAPASNSGSSTTATATPRDGSSSTPAAMAAQPGGRGLTGLYVISEVDDNGKVAMISSDNEVSLFFESNGFTRITKEGGKVVHTDGGSYRIESPDQLVLATSVSDKKPLMTPSEKAYKFGLSPDGDELKLSGTGDRVAVFRRKTDSK